MQKTAESKIKRIEIGTFLIEGIRTIKAIPCSEEANSWNIIDASTIVELDELELKKVKATGSDEKKVLEVKRLLLQNFSISNIKEKTGFSRTTIYRYKKLLSAMNTKKPEKNTKSTKTLKSVLPIWLFIIGLPLKSTIVIIALLFLLCIYIKIERTRKQYIKHKEETSKLFHLLTIASNYSYKKKAIACASDKEAAYFRKVLAFYRNKSREIIILPRELGENNSAYFDRKEKEKNQYNFNNLPKIKEGEKSYNQYWDKLQELNLLDYFHFPKGKNWLESKCYILSAVEFIKENPEPIELDRSKGKLLIDVLPNSKLTNKEIKKLKKKTPKIVQL